MKNTLSDLNNHLFAQLERLNDENLCGDDLKDEIVRAKSVMDISSTIIENAKTEISNKQLQVEVVKLISSGALTPAGEKTANKLIE